MGERSRDLQEADPTIRDRRIERLETVEELMEVITGEPFTEEVKKTVEVAAAEGQQSKYYSYSVILEETAKVNCHPTIVQRNSCL